MADTENQTTEIDMGDGTFRWTDEDGVWYEGTRSNYVVMGAEDEVFYCAMQTYSASRYQPAEYCENEVDDEGDYCRGCQAYEDGPDPDDARDAWLEMSWEDRYGD